MPSKEGYHITRIAAVALLAGMSLSPALWGFADRGGFPLLPVSGPAMESFGGFWPGIALAAGLVWLFLFPQKKLVAAGLILVTGLICSVDLTRLQPWVWFYMLVFAIGLLDGNQRAYWYLLAGMYVWSGFNKLNPYFVEDNFTWFCEAFSWTQQIGTITWIGYCVALGELLLGLGLCWSKSRRISGIGLIGMHLLIITFLIKLQWNLVVIPWNIALIGILWRLTQTKTEKVAPGSMPKKLIAPIALVWLAPALNHLGNWPHTMSWQLYSNTQPEATYYSVLQPAPDNPAMVETWKKHAYPYDGGKNLLLDDWAMDRLNVPMFYSNHGFEQMAQYLCSKTDELDATAGLFILRVSIWNSALDQDWEIKCR